MDLDGVLLLFEAVYTRDPATDDLSSLFVLLCGSVSGQDSAVSRRDPLVDGCESDWCDPSLGGWEPLVDGRDPVTVDTRDPDCDPDLLPPLLVTPSRVPLFVLPVALEASFTDDLLDGRLSVVLLSLCLLAV